MEVSPPAFRSATNADEFNLVNAYNAPLWVITCADDENHGFRRNGCVVGCVACAAVPSAIGGRMVVAISVEHKTTEIIKRTGRFVLNLLSSHQLDLVQHFGFQSGHSVDKFDSAIYGDVFDFWVLQDYGIPVIADTCGWMALAVVQTCEFPDRIIFICNIEKQQVYSTESDIITKEVYGSAEVPSRSAITGRTPLRCFDVFAANRSLPDPSVVVQHSVPPVD